MTAAFDERPNLHDDNAFAMLCGRQSDVVSLAQALTYFSRAAIRHRVESGRWRPAARAVYLVRPGPLSEGQRLWVALLAAGYGEKRAACLGGITALRVWGLRRIEADAVHLLVPVATRLAVLPPYVRTHRTRHLPADEETHGTRPPATLPARSVVDAAQWARSDKEARLIIAASFQQCFVSSLGDIEREARQNTARRKLILATAADCAGGSHTLGELDFIALCRKYRLPVPTRQVPVIDRQGRTRHLDALFEEWKVAVEIDGVQHEDVSVSWDDAERQNSLTLDGYTVLRYPSSYVREHPERVAAEIREALLTAGWRPGRGR